MNPDSCRTIAPSRVSSFSDDIEWAFAPGDISLVAHVPTEGNTFECIRLDEKGALEDLSPKGRAMVRALLDLAQRNLDATEPSMFNIAGAVSR